MVKMRQMLSSNCSIVSELPTASRHSKQQQSQQQQQQQPTSKIRKSESSSKSTLADGTEISESSILESHPDGSSVETTTQIKVSSVIKTKYNKRTGKEVQVEETLTVETVTRREQRLLTTANPELDKQQRQEEEVENEDENEVALNILSSFSCKQDTTNIAAIQEGCEGKDNNNDTTAAIPTNENSRSSSSSCYSPTSFFRKTHPAVSSNANTSSSNGLIANHAADTATSNSRSVSFDIHNDQHQQHQQHRQHQSSKLTIFRGPSSSASPSSSQQPHLTNANSSTSMPPALPNLPSNSSNSDKSNKSNKSSKDNNHNTNKNAAAPLLLLRPPSSSSEPIKSKSTNKLSNKQAPPSPKSAPTPQPKPQPKPTPTPTTMSSSKALVKYDHKPLLTQDADFATPQVTISGDNAVVTDDSCIHFFSFHHTSNNSNNNTKTAKTAAIGKWVHSTTVAIENTYCINVALSSTSNTCIVGVPYDKNTKGFLTGAAYIFEKDEVKGTWFQIKKIIPKQEVMQVAAGAVTPNNALITTNANGGEFATIGYSVGIDGDTIVVGVPHVGNCKRGGSVYVYKRVQRYKWLQKGSLLLPSSTTGIQGIQQGEEEDKDNNGITKKKKNMIMIKNKKPTNKKFGKIVAVKGNIVVVSDHHTQDETCISVFECNASTPSSSSLALPWSSPLALPSPSSLPSKKWNLLHENLLTDGQCRNFGSTLALTNEGGILVGCNAKVNPTEVLYFCKSADNKYGASVGGNGTYQLQQVISISEKSNKRNAATEDISDFKVDGNKFILGTSCGGGGDQHCVYIYELQQDINQWMLLAKVDDPAIEKFGNSVALSGGKVLIGAKTNAYSYQLDGMVRKKRSKRSIFSGSKRNTVKSLIDDVTSANHESGYVQEPCSGLELLDLRSRSQKLLLQQQAQQGGVGGSNSSLSSSRLSLSLNRPKPKGWPLLRSRMRSQSPMREDRSPSNTLRIGRMSSPSPMRRK